MLLCIKSGVLDKYVINIIIVELGKLCKTLNRIVLLDFLPEFRACPDDTICSVNLKKSLLIFCTLPGKNRERKYLITSSLDMLYSTKLYIK